MGNCLSTEAALTQSEWPRTQRIPDYSRLKYLPVVNYSAKEKNSSCECCYCLELFATDDQVTILPCFHIFHAACVRHWLAEHFICPLCRYDINIGISSAQLRTAEKLRAFLSRLFACCGGSSGN